MGRHFGRLRGMSLVLRAAAASHLGPVRENNEDAWHAGSRLVAVADGIGGMPAGDVASEITMRTLAPLDEDLPRSPFPALLEAVELANDRIRQAAEADPARDGMGTTVTALLLTGRRLGVVHVGDSRAYLLRRGVLEQVTKDDTYVQTLVDRGVLSAGEARHHPRRSVIVQAVQGQPVEPAAIVLTPRAGDRFLVCSDGLSDAVEDDALASTLLAYPDPKECADRLIRLALDAGGLDNVTAIVADVAAA
jgi:protein phosphatase